MRALTAALTACLVLLVASSSRAVTIDPGGYNGRYYVSGVGGPFYGENTFALAAGTYQLDTGAEIGGSALTFDVDAAGNVIDFAPVAAATASGSTLALNTVTIAIATGNYAGRYFLSTFGTSVELRGDQSVTVVPALTYTIDDGAEVDSGTSSSAFVFSVDAVGNVSTNSPAAQADGTTATLTFVTVPVQINPQAYSGQYIITSFAPTEYTGAQAFNVPPGIVYTIDNGQSIGGSAFPIVVDAAGHVSTTSGAATAAGNVLTFANVVIHVDPTAAGGPVSVGPYENLTQPTDVILIPTLTIVVTTPTGSALATPSVGVIETVPSLPDITLSGSPFNTTRQTKV